MIVFHSHYLLPPCPIRFKGITLDKKYIWVSLWTKIYMSITLEKKYIFSQKFATLICNKNAVENKLYRKGETLITHKISKECVTSINCKYGHSNSKMRLHISKALFSKILNSRSRSFFSK